MTDLLKEIREKQNRERAFQLAYDTAIFEFMLQEELAKLEAEQARFITTDQDK